MHLPRKLTESTWNDWRLAERDGCLVVPRMIFILISQPSFLGKPRSSVALLAGAAGSGARGKLAFKKGDKDFYF
jgi:hypothetical protein